MDVTKVAKLALQFSQTLPDGHEKKEQLVTMATHWTTNHQRNPMTLNAMNDARGIQVKTIRVHCRSFTHVFSTKLASAPSTTMPLASWTESKHEKLNTEERIFRLLQLDLPMYAPLTSVT